MEEEEEKLLMWPPGSRARKGAPGTGILVQVSALPQLHAELSVLPQMTPLMSAVAHDAVTFKAARTLGDILYLNYG